jgi:hypothetical protein
MVFLLGREVTVAVADVGNPASITRSFSFRAEVSYIQSIMYLFTSIANMYSKHYLHHKISTILLTYASFIQSCTEQYKDEHASFLSFYLDA